MIDKLPKKVNDAKENIRISQADNHSVDEWRRRYNNMMTIENRFFKALKSLKIDEYAKLHKSFDNLLGQPDTTTKQIIELYKVSSQVTSTASIMNNNILEMKSSLEEMKANFPDHRSLSPMKKHIIEWEHMEEEWIHLSKKVVESLSKIEANEIIESANKAIIEADSIRGRAKKLLVPHEINIKHNANKETIKYLADHKNVLYQIKHFFSEASFIYSSAVNCIEIGKKINKFDTDTLTDINTKLPTWEKRIQETSNNRDYIDNTLRILENVKIEDTK